MAAARISAFVVGSVDPNTFVNATADRYVPLTDNALRFAAELWAQARRSGRPTADATALDIDVLLAAQALRVGGTPIVATTNQKHLSQFISALHWTDISPNVFRVP